MTSHLFQFFSKSFNRWRQCSSRQVVSLLMQEILRDHLLISRSIQRGFYFGIFFPNLLLSLSLSPFFTFLSRSVFAGMTQRERELAKVVCSTLLGSASFKLLFHSFLVWGAFSPGNFNWPLTTGGFLKEKLSDTFIFFLSLFFLFFYSWMSECVCFPFVFSLPFRFELSATILFPPPIRRCAKISFFPYPPLGRTEE